MSREFKTWSGQIRRTFTWHRRIIAALCAVGCVAGTYLALRPAPPATVSVVIAAKELAAGTKLGESDLRQAQLPPDAVPSQTATKDQLLGRTLTAAMPQGQVITPLSVLGPDLAKTMPGRVLTPVRLAESGVTTLLSVGSMIDVLAVGNNGTRTVAKGARVVTLPKADSGGGIMAGGGGNQSPLIILDVSVDEATLLAQAAAEGRLAITLRNP